MMPALALLLGGVGQARATFVTDSSGFSSPQVIDFSQSGSFTFTPGPVLIGSPVGQNITWSSTDGYAVIGNGGYGLGSNGIWDSGRNGYTGLNASVGDMTFSFNSGPVSAVGGFINYAPGVGPDLIITALAADGSVLESYDINQLAPISTPGQYDAGAFRGIIRPTADIAAFRVSNEVAVLDNLTFSQPAPNAVPAPSTLAMLGTALFTCLGYFGWRRRKLAAA
jgi:hypothetical protein